MLKVVELFAGVGGFRIGLEATKKFEVIWSNQWEPSTKAQHASWVYENRFGNKGHSNENIEEVDTKEYPLHVYNAVNYWDPKFKGKYTYREFLFRMEETIYSAFDESRELESDLRNKILKLESELLPVKSSSLSPYFVENIIFYVLIILYGLRLFLYLIILSIRVLRKG